MIRMEMLVSLINRFIFLVCSFDIVSTFSNISQKEYNYDFEVRLVDSCPMNELDWQAAAEKIGCNDTQGYHCVPDKFLESLIQFCYHRPRILVSKGNCLELAANGILNHVKCQNFTRGCPDKPYFSDRIYDYPICLKIEDRCFTSDIRCLRQRLKDLKSQILVQPSTPRNFEEQRHFDTLHTIWINLIVLFVSICLLIVSVIILIYIKKKTRRANADEEKVPMIKKKSEARKRDDISERGPYKSAFQVYQIVLREVESEILVADTYLSQLLRRHCRNGSFRDFEYLLEKMILRKTEDASIQRILTLHDNDGYTLLHFAAEGGSVDIFKALINAMDKQNVYNTTYDGRTVLHIACKNNQVSLCRFLLFENDYKTILLDKKSYQGWNAAHYTAACGSIQILKFLEENGLDITIKSHNGLNILDIACLHNHKDICKFLINRNDLSLLLDNSDENGWTIAHFAAMVGNNDVFKCLIEKNANIEVKTKRQKTVLHVSCEYGNNDICTEILKYYDSILYEKDDEDWNALHYAAKGGNLEIFKEIEKKFKERAHLCEQTRDKKTVLHIACISENSNICEYICNSKSYTDIINSKVSLKGWTAAHYVAAEIKQDGTEEKLIRMLVKSGIDLKAVTTDGLTVLGVACEHQNKKLINFLLKKHNELLAVGIPYLKNAAIASNDDNIKSQIYEALANYNRKKVEFIA